MGGRGHVGQAQQPPARTATSGNIVWSCISTPEDQPQSLDLALQSQKAEVGGLGALTGGAGAVGLSRISESSASVEKEEPQVSSPLCSGAVQAWKGLKASPAFLRFLRRSI